MTTFAEGRERNLALGVYGAASGSGAAAGVVLGGVLTSYLSWSWIFFVNVPVGLAAIAATPWLLRESRADLGHRHFDLGGSATVTAGLMLLVYALTRATTDGWGSAQTLGSLAVAAALIARVRGDRAAVEVPAAPAADLPPPHARGRERDDGDRRRRRLLGVLPAHALPPGHPRLLADAERPRLHRVRIDRGRRLERRAARRRAARRAHDAHDRPAALDRLRRPADARAAARPLLLGPLPGVRARRRGHGALVRPGDDREPHGGRPLGCGRGVGPR